VLQPFGWPGLITGFAIGRLQRRMRCDTGQHGLRAVGRSLLPSEGTDLQPKSCTDVKKSFLLYVDPSSQRGPQPRGGAPMWPLTAPPTNDRRLRTVRNGRGAAMGLASELEEKGVVG
jgi:hypothetical protein